MSKMTMTIETVNKKIFVEILEVILSIHLLNIESIPYLRYSLN
ncbi:hypothetical protein F3D3_0171 [Fusibacter sp. 3D3]|nr:hypothetical protein F3D3_0171 [Fusibacter sp. 3D3]